MPIPKPRRVGNPNNQTVRAFRGVSAESLRAQRLAKKGPEGQADRVVSYDTQAVRAAIEAQTCPFCGRGPFKVIAVHTNKMHGVDKWELRNLAGLTSSESICASDYSEGARDRAVRRKFHEYGGQTQKKTGRRPQRWTSAGLARNTQIIRSVNASTDPATLQQWRQKAGEARAAQMLGRDGCHNGHPWTEDNTRRAVNEAGKTYRVCRACEKERSRARQGFDGSGEVVIALGTVRRIQALAAIGYPVHMVAERVGMSHWWATSIMKRGSNGGGVIRATAEAIAALYEELKDTPAPSSKSSKIAVTIARKKGWIPPSGWTPEQLDAEA